MVLDVKTEYNQLLEMVDHEEKYLHKQIAVYFDNFSDKNPTFINILIYIILE